MSLIITIENDDAACGRSEQYRILVIKRLDAEGRFYYEVDRLKNEVRMSSRSGRMKPPRSNHPDFIAQLARRVLAHAFPFVPDLTYRDTPRGPDAVARD